MGKRLKYMGIAHVQELLEGDDFGGRLNGGIPRKVEFDRSNNWVVDADEAGLSQDAIDVLVSTGEFLDVSDMPRIPLNRHQTTFLGMKDGDKIESSSSLPEGEELQYAAADDPEEQAKREAVAAEQARLEAEEQKRIEAAAATEQAKAKKEK